jgi:hypothetical protein
MVHATKRGTAKKPTTKKVATKKPPARKAPARSAAVGPKVRRAPSRKKARTTASASGPARHASKTTLVATHPPKKAAARGAVRKQAAKTPAAKRRTQPSARRASTARPRRGSPRALRVTLEVGPKHKRVVAVAPDWPGLERGGKSDDEAIEALWAYVPRYAKVARLARMHPEFAALTDVDVVEQYTGTGSTDFWGISFAFSSLDGKPISRAELERQLRLVRGCWTYFDGVRERVSPEMRKGPRGGGRDRDRIVRHVLAVEQDWAKKLGVQTPNDEVVLDEAGLRAYRDAYLKAIRAFHAEDKMARNWPLQYLIRHTGYHTMDHAWEMEDKDLSGETG